MRKKKTTPCHVCFSVRLQGHAECVQYVKSFNLPTLVLGGGGYNIRNVSRCWTYETAVILDQDISNSTASFLGLTLDLRHELHCSDIPYNDFFQYYGPDYCLHLQPSEMVNKNDRDYLEEVKCAFLMSDEALSIWCFQAENLSKLELP